jgi:hypothetical protein
MILTAYLYVTAHMTGLTSRPSVARYAAMRPLSSRAPGSHWAWTSGRSNPSNGVCRHAEFSERPIWSTSS